MGIVLCADGFTIPELRCHDAQRHAQHHQTAGVSVAQDMKADSRGDARSLTGGLHGPMLLAFVPPLPIRARQDQPVAALSRSELAEERATFFGEHDVA
jgi:hypothetical protein